MKGGFYNTKLLKSCGWTDPDVVAPAVVDPVRLNNYCKDNNNNVILNLYKPQLNELLTQIEKDIIKFDHEKQIYFEQIPSIKIIGDAIFDIFTIYQYNKKIKTYNDEIEQAKLQHDKLQDDMPALKKLEANLEKLKADRQKIMDKKSQIHNNDNIDKELVNSDLRELLEQNSKEIIKFINKIKIIGPLKKQASELNTFIRKYYDSVTGKWLNKCINNIELERILGSSGSYSYGEHMKQLNQYFKQEIKKYDDDIKCIIPFTNNPNNIFEHIKDKNFKIYSKLGDVYYEIYNHTTIPAASAASASAAEGLDYTNYLLDVNYVLEKIQHIPNKIEKQVLYPNYSSLSDPEQKRKKLSFIIYNSDNTLNNLIFALKINTLNNIDKFLDRHMINNTSNLILPYNNYTLLDIFIISNEFNSYYELQSYDFFYLPDYEINTTIYTREYYENGTDNKFIKFIKDQIYSDKDINMENFKSSDEFKIQIHNFKIIDKYCNETIKNFPMLITTYNYLSLLNIKITPELSNFEKINTHLKYNSIQIKMLILIDLYKEVVENYLLHMYYDCNDIIIILLNVIYYKSIYKWDKVRNLINYSMQFNYLKTEHYYYDVDVNYNDYEQNFVPIKPTIDHNKTYNKFYLNLFANDKIKYNPFNYSNYKMLIKKYKKDKSVSESYVSSCGEILVFNIINLLIYNNRINDIDPELLPEGTIEKIRNFYRGKTLGLFHSNPQIIIKEFIPLLHNIPFFIIPDIKKNVYNHHYEQDGMIMEGTEILPSYINVCRILGYLFGHKIDDGKKIICKHDILKTIFRSFGGNIKEMLLLKFIPSTVLDDTTFIQNEDITLTLNNIELFFSVGHGEMRKQRIVDPDNYIDFPYQNEKIYGNIIKHEPMIIFSYLKNSKILEQMKIIFSNNYYKNLFKADIFTHLNTIISLRPMSIIDFIKLLMFLGYNDINDINDFINKIIQGNTNLTPKILLITTIFKVYNNQIDFGKINIENFKSMMLLLNDEDILRLIFFSEPVSTFLLKMGQDVIDIIFDKILIKINSNSNEILIYIKLYKPKKFDIIKFCDRIENSIQITEIVIEYLLTVVSIEEQIILFNKLYIDGEKIGNINNFINKLVQTYTYEKNEKNDRIINILNQSLTILLDILMIKDIDDEFTLATINNIISQYITNMQQLVLTKELFEDKYYYCLFKSFIYYNKKFINNKIKYELQTQKELILRFIRLISKIVPLTHENINHIFSSEIGKELLESFRLHIDPEGISYKLEEVKHFNFKILAPHQAKYLKYKRKYLQLKKFI